MPIFPTRADAEPRKGINLRGTLLAMLAGFLLACALLTLATRGLGSLPSPAEVDETRAATAAAEPAETFDYFPSHYVNQAKEIEPLPETF